MICKKNTQVIGIALSVIKKAGNMSKIKDACLCGRIDGLQQQIDELPVIPNLVLEDVYEHMIVWGEEAGRLRNNSAQYSYGNGATGFMGIPIPPNQGWELVGISLHADTYPALATVNIAVHNYAVATPGSAAPILGTISLANAADGGGWTNNPFKYVDLSGAPVPLPSPTILGLRTITVTGVVSDVRVAMYLRRSAGQFYKQGV